MGCQSRALRAPQLCVPAVSSVLPILRILAATGVLLGSVAPVCADSMTPAPEGPRPQIRVLLYEGPGPLRVQSAGEVPVSIRGGGGLVRVGKGAPVARWSSPPRRLHEVASRRVRGRVEAVGSVRGFLLVNHLDLEDYLAGTLGREMYASWPPQALRAQAVASRTYALRHARDGLRNGQLWDVGADTQHQVYGGVAAETRSVRAAVAATRGEVLVYAEEPILAAFHSASGGRTASAEEVWGEALPYLVSVPVADEDDSPDTYWRASVSASTLGRALEAAGWPVGALRTVEVVDRSPSGRVLSVELRGTRGRATLTGREVRSLVGESTIKSTLFEIRESGHREKSKDQFARGWTFVGSGRGHGVGMSQWGARAMAEDGADYRGILAAFYPGARIERWPVSDARGVRQAQLHDTVERLRAGAAR